MFCDPFHKSIELPPTLNMIQEPVKRDLQRACAIHSNVRTKYAVAALLYQEAIKAAQSYEQQANDALTELTDLTVHVRDCLDLAMKSVEPAPCKPESQQGTISSFLPWAVYVNLTFYQCYRMREISLRFRNGCDVHPMCVILELRRDVPMLNFIQAND
jgi:hypothetical protein